jgi:hypothetical protein
MKRLQSSLKGIITSFYFNSQNERFIAVVGGHYNRHVMSGHRFHSPVINP